MSEICQRVMIVSTFGNRYQGCQRAHFLVFTLLSYVYFYDQTKGFKICIFILFIYNVDFCLYFAFLFQVIL